MSIDGAAPTSRKQYQPPAHARVALASRLDRRDRSSASSSGGRSDLPFSFSHSGAERCVAGATTIRTAGPTRWSGCSTRWTACAAAWSAAASASVRPPSSGNRAFDEYRTETLQRLEEEQVEFKNFLDRLRHAKDKEEFDTVHGAAQAAPDAAGRPAAGLILRPIGSASGDMPP